jgi:hypothetical protein
MNRKELNVFMFYILLIAFCMIISVFIFGNLKLNLWAGLCVGFIVGFVLSLILWKFYGSKYANSPPQESKY